MTDTVIAILSGSAAGSVAFLGWLLVLPRLRPPADDPADLYRQVATWPWAVLCGVLAAGTAVMSSWVAPTWSLPLWTVTAAIATPLAVLDGLTHRIPARVCHAAWILAPLAATVGAAVTGHWAGLVVFAVGGLGSGALFLVLWLLPRSNLGFGDVRYAPIIGAAAATLGGTGWVGALLVAAVLALTGFALARVVPTRQRLLPWAPFLFAGLVAGLLFTW